MSERKDFLKEIRDIADIVEEAQLCLTILRYGRSGHATPAMIEAAISLVDRCIAYCVKGDDRSLLKTAEDCKAGLQQVLIDGVQTLRRPKPPGPELTDVEEPLARFREKVGHKLQRQKKCAGGIIDIYDVSANQLIECKFRGTSGSLGEAAGQLQRYRKSFPDAELCIAVFCIEPGAEWMAEVLMCSGIRIIEVQKL